jgi:putative lipoic acid-binding regulatory protein
MSEEIQRYIDLLNATHEFPCVFTFKVIGAASPAFEQSVVMAVRAVVTEQAELTWSTRFTPAGRHMSVSVDSVVSHAMLVLQVYERLKSVEGVVLLL